MAEASQEASKSINNKKHCFPTLLQYIKKTAVNNFCFFYFIMPRVSFRDTVEEQTLNGIAVKIWRIK